MPNVGHDGFTDLNNLTTRSGLYYFGIINNVPEPYVAVLNIVSKPDVLQIAFAMSSAKIYRRRHSSTSWTSWAVINFA